MAENVTVTPHFKGEPFDKMLRRFRNKCERAAIIQDYKKHEFFDKPSAKKNRKNQELKRTKLNNKRKEMSLQERRKILANQRFR
jgi:small subunit ribosomal protein S21